MEVLPGPSGSSQPEVEKLVRLYVATKRLIIRAEELDPALCSNIAIIKEQRDALDHLMRVVGDRFGQTPKGEQYCRDNLDKAIGHIFRAAYDALDSLAISTKTRIAQALGGRSNEAISACLPDYFPRYSRELQEIDKQIIDSRAAKDVGAIAEAKLNAYMAVVERASEIRMFCEAAVPAMVDFERRESAYDGLRRLATDTRARIDSALKGRSNEAISACLPDYFPKHSKDLQDLEEAIEAERPANEMGVVAEAKLQALRVSVGKASAILAACEAAVPGMADFDRRGSKERRSDWVGWTILTIIGVVLGVWLDRNWPSPKRDQGEGTESRPTAAQHANATPTAAADPKGH